MRVQRARMPVPMCVRLARAGVGRMGMLVVGVMDVRMLMFHRLVQMFVLMALDQVQKKPCGHQQPGDH